MADINLVVLVGRLTRDAELKYTANGMPICKFSLAVNKRRKDGDQWKDEASFFDIVLWGKSGEAINQYLVKGKQIAVEGELHQNRWEQDGQARSKVEIMANNVQLLGSAGGEGRSEGGRGPGPGSGSQKSEPARQAGGGSYESAPSDGFADDIPF